MDPGQHFALNTQRIAYQTFDNEVVIIDFKTGSYFSIDKVGAFIWSQIESRSSLDDIIAKVKNSHSTDGKDIHAIVTKFAQLLVEESLIIPTEETAIPGRTESGGGKSECPQIQEDFQEPLLHKFTDMQELLLLDPIHDVQDDGWPGKRTE